MRALQPLRVRLPKTGTVCSHAVGERRICASAKKSGPTARERLSRSACPSEGVIRPTKRGRPAYQAIRTDQEIRL